MKKLLCLVLSLLPLLAFADETTVIHVTQQSPQFKITQPSNGTTGYQWTVKYDHNVLHLNSEKYVVPKSKLIGVPGKTIWVFTAKPAAFQTPNTQTQIILNYARPWDKNDHPTDLIISVQFS